MTTLVGNHYLFVPSSFTDGVFSMFWRKLYGSNPSKMDIKVVNPGPTQKIII